MRIIMIIALSVGLLVPAGAASAAPKPDSRCQCSPQFGTGTHGPGWHRNAIGGGQVYGRHGR